MASKKSDLAASMHLHTNHIQLFLLQLASISLPGCQLAYGMHLHQHLLCNHMPVPFGTIPPILHDTLHRFNREKQKTRPRLPRDLKDRRFGLNQGQVIIGVLNGEQIRIFWKQVDSKYSQNDTTLILILLIDFRARRMSLQACQQWR